MPLGRYLAAGLSSGSARTSPRRRRLAVRRSCRRLHAERPSRDALDQEPPCHRSSGWRSAASVAHGPLGWTTSSARSRSARRRTSSSSTRRSPSRCPASRCRRPTPGRGAGHGVAPHLPHPSGRSVPPGSGGDVSAGRRWHGGFRPPRRRRSDRRRTGAPARGGSVAIRDGRLRAFGPGDPMPQARRTSTRPGSWSRPGSSTSTPTAARDPRRPAPRAQGAPGRDDRDRRASTATATRRSAARGPGRVVDLNAGLDGRPEIDYDWDSVASYLDRSTVARRSTSASSSATARCASARVGWDDRARRRRANRIDARPLREAMEAGAFGISSGLDYPPGVVRLDRGAGGAHRRGRRAGGIYHTHVRYALGDRFLDPFREAIEIGRRGEGAGPHHPLLPPRDVPGPPEQMLALVDDARAEGLDVTFDTYPSEWARTRLLIQLPPWVQAAVRCRSRSASPIPASATGSVPSSASAAPPTPRPRAGPTCGWRLHRSRAQRWEARTSPT